VASTLLAQDRAGDAHCLFRPWLGSHASVHCAGQSATNATSRVQQHASHGDKRVGLLRCPWCCCDHAYAQPRSAAPLPSRSSIRVAGRLRWGWRRSVRFTVVGAMSVIADLSSASAVHVRRVFDFLELYEHLVPWRYAPTRKPWPCLDCVLGLSAISWARLRSSSASASSVISRAVKFAGLSPLARICATTNFLALCLASTTTAWPMLAHPFSGAFW